MAEDKNSFIFYTNWLHVFDKLSDEEAGMLIKHMLRYVNDINPVAPNRIIELVFEPLKQVLKKDLKRYKTVIERNRINGSKGGRPKKINGEEEPKKPTGFLGYEIKNYDLEKKPNYPKKPSGLSGFMEQSINELQAKKTEIKKPKKPKKADNDIDIDIDIKFKEKEREGVLEKTPTSGSEKPEAVDQKKNDKISFSEIKDLWNSTCISFPKLFTLSENRKNKIRLRIEEMGGAEKAIPVFRQILEKMQESNFLKGDNNRGWRASFDWLFENGKNWVKVYEGNYSNQTGGEKTGARQIVSKNQYSEF